MEWNVESLVEKNSRGKETLQGGTSLFLKKKKKKGAALKAMVVVMYGFI